MSCNTCAGRDTDCPECGPRPVAPEKPKPPMLSTDQLFAVINMPVPPGGAAIDDQDRKSEPIFLTYSKLIREALEELRRRIKQ